MNSYDNEVTALRFMLDGNRDKAKTVIQQLTTTELYNLNDALDLYAVMVDAETIRRIQGES